MGGRVRVGTLGGGERVVDPGGEFEFGFEFEIEIEIEFHIW